MSITDTFDPDRNGWIFENWGENSPLSWDLFRRTYIGINPSQDCLEAPLDCLFYEIFKNCANGGNCGGLSLLALAIYKHGGWMGFCGPANFYTGVDHPQPLGPDRQDLYEAINIYQARQFSASGIENFIDMVDSGNLNNAVTAFNTVKSHLGNGDYCVLSIANDAIGDLAHTIIPYRAVESGGTRYLYVWDSNTPYDDYGTDHYDSGKNRVVINSATDWEYIQRDGTPLAPGDSYRRYSGQPTGWCFAIPMSKVLRKARHPLALDMVMDGLIALFVSGPGAAVTQIEDDQGRRFYTSDVIHTSRGDFEADSARRLPGVARWPWYGDANGSAPGELYFIRGAVGRRKLRITLSGRKPSLQHVSSDSIVELQASTTASSRDVIELAGVGTANQGVRLSSSNPKRRFNVEQLRMSRATQDWRSIQVKGLRPGTKGLDLRTTADLLAMEVVTRGAKQVVNANLSRLRDGELQQDRVSKLQVTRTRRGKLNLPR